MAMADSQEVRQLLANCLPGLRIDENLRPSGQRLVYFCRFVDDGQQSTLPTTHESVVLKVSENLDPTIIARLEKEREILDSLDSAYFPKLLYYQVFSFDPVSERKLRHSIYVTVEERIDGGPLSDRRSSFSTASETAYLLQSLTQGMRLLWEHPRRIVHRDLKPDNIIIRQNRTPVIIDLGIVREEGSRGLTGTQWSIGPCTPGYASPEQLKNEKHSINFRSDFFSLGVIAYELLSGSNPYRHKDSDPMDVVIERTIQSEPAALFDLGCAPDRLSRLISSMLAREPYRRPRTVDALAQELDQIVGEIN